MTDHPPDPKDDGSKIPAATYAWMIPVATRVARRFGYAIAVHGSMSRDLDLIAVPWVKTASEPLPMIEAIAEMLDGKVIPAMEVSAHGRIAYNIVFEGAWHFIDISVTPHIEDNQEIGTRYPPRDCCAFLLAAMETIRRMCKTVSSNPNYARVDIAETIERQCTEAISKHKAQTDAPKVCVQ